MQNGSRREGVRFPKSHGVMPGRAGALKSQLPTPETSSVVTSDGINIKRKITQVWEIDFWERDGEERIK